LSHRLRQALTTAKDSLLQIVRQTVYGSSLAADVLVRIYAQQFKAGDAGGASRTLNEALDIVENVEQHPNTPGPYIASRYENLIQLAVAGGAKAAAPILERLYGRAAVVEAEPAQKQQLLSHLAPSQALLGDFAGAVRSAKQLPPGEQRDKALLSIAAAQASQGDIAGARFLASEVSSTGWNNLALQGFGLALAASGDYLGALSTIEKGAGQRSAGAVFRAIGPRRSWQVLGLYRKRSGRINSGKTWLFGAGAFSIERLEVSRFGAAVLCVLNGVGGGGRG
jgi:hypothetical protein